MESTVTSMTYLPRPRAVTWAFDGPDWNAVGAAARRERRVAPTFGTDHGTSLSAFGSGSAHSDKCIDVLPLSGFVADDVTQMVGILGIRSWSPPV